MIPPPSAPTVPTDPDRKVLLGDGWKPLASGVVADQFVRFCEASMRNRKKDPLEPAPVDDDNLQVLKNTIAAGLDQLAPGLVVPWWVGLPMAFLFVWLDLRTAARPIARAASASPEASPGASEGPAESPGPAAGPAPPAAPAAAPGPSRAVAKFRALRPSAVVE